MKCQWVISRGKKKNTPCPKSSKVLTNVDGIDYYYCTDHQRVAKSQSLSSKININNNENVSLLKNENECESNTTIKEINDIKKFESKNQTIKNDTNKIENVKIENVKIETPKNDRKYLPIKDEFYDYEDHKKKFNDRLKYMFCSN